jgi:hypothetical protein
MEVQVATLSDLHGHIGRLEEKLSEVQQLVLSLSQSVTGVQTDTDAKLSAVMAELQKIEQLIIPPPAGPAVTATIMWRSLHNPEGSFVSDVTIKDSQGNELGTVTLTDANGAVITNPDSPPVWTTDDTAGAVITLNTSSDPSGLTVTITPVAPGTANVTVTETNTDGTNAVGTGVVTVTPGDAAALNIAWSPTS